jgi:hypothetical protein
MLGFYSSVPIVSVGTISDGNSSVRRCYYLLGTRKKVIVITFTFDKFNGKTIG